jgi:hypothetical protein
MFRTSWSGARRLLGCGAEEVEQGDKEALPARIKPLVKDVVEVRPRLILPNSWRDYLGKDLAALGIPKLPALQDCADRARFILQDLDNETIAETIDVIEALLESVDRNQTVTFEHKGGRFERTLQRFDVPKHLILARLLTEGRPVIPVRNRPRRSGSGASRTASEIGMDHLGIDPLRSDAVPVYLASLALRDAFAAARLYIEVTAYGGLDPGVDADEEASPQDIIDACAAEMDVILDDVLHLTALAADKLAYAMEAVGMAETTLRRPVGPAPTPTDREQHHAEFRSDAAKRAAHARHAGHRTLKEFAVKLYQAGSFKSIRQAAKKVYLEVQEHADRLGIPRLSADRGEQTVYDWLLQHAK